jgi:hypothetical protein
MRMKPITGLPALALTNAMPVTAQKLFLPGQWRQ